MMMMMMMIMITTMRISFTAISLVQQVAQRFRDNSIAQDLEQVGFRLEGMPDASPPTIAHVSNADVRNAERQNINRRKVSRYTWQYRYSFAELEHHRPLSGTKTAW